MRTNCPRCGQLLEVEDRFNGQQVRCTCGQVFPAVPAAVQAGPTVASPGMYGIPPEAWPYTQGLTAQQMGLFAAAYTSKRKDTTVFILLAVLLGAYGVHWFYLGNTNRGLTYLLITVLTCCLGGLIVWILSVVEAVNYQQHVGQVNGQAAQMALAETRAYQPGPPIPQPGPT